MRVKRPSVEVPLLDACVCPKTREGGEQESWGHLVLLGTLAFSVSLGLGCPTRMPLPAFSSSQRVYAGGGDEGGGRRTSAAEQKKHEKFFSRGTRAETTARGDPFLASV